MNEHRKMTTESIISVSKIDFTGNGQPDFLMTTLIPQDGYNRKWLWWVRDDFTVYRKVEIGVADYEIWKYINLDNDPELEMITALGYEDGIDYSIDDPDYKLDGVLKRSVLFTPIVKYMNGPYWGYPWNWDWLSFNEENRRIEVILNPGIYRDGNVEKPKEYEMPVVFFVADNKGSTTVNLKAESEWLTLDELFEGLKL